MRKSVVLLFSALLIYSAWGQKLTGSEWLGQISLGELQSRYGNIFISGVDLYKISYQTTGWDGTPDIASGLLILPQLKGVTLPMVIYMHGTISHHDSVPSNLPYESQVPIIYGGIGGISFAPDYLGFGDSKGFHPYHHSETESSVGADMILAVREFLRSESIHDNGQLFISGYSQGGHAAATLHRKLEDAPILDVHIVASAFMSGAYSLSGIMLPRILSDEEYDYPAFVLNLLLSYNMVYGLYPDLNQLFKHPYDELAGILYREEVNLGHMNELLKNQLKMEYGAIRPKYMIQDSVWQNVLNNSGHPLVKALKENDIFDWTPRSPVILIYCREDEQVPFYNALLTDSVMRANGAPDVQLFEADRTEDHVGCAEPAIFASLLFFSTHLTNTIAEEGPYSQLRIYPNPAAHSINIEGFPPGSELKLYDIKGQMVLKTLLSQESYRLDLDLPRGLYVATVYSNKGIWRGKLVVH